MYAITAPVFSVIDVWFLDDVAKILDACGNLLVGGPSTFRNVLIASASLRLMVERCDCVLRIASKHFRNFCGPSVYAHPPCIYGSLVERRRCLIQYLLTLNEQGKQSFLTFFCL